MPRLEELESRTAPAVTVGISGGVLNVTSDAAADTISIDHVGSSTRVFRFSLDPSPFVAADSAISSILVSTGAGADTVNLWRTVKPTTITNSSVDTDTVNLGNSANGVQAITAQVTVTNLVIGFIRLTINDTGNTVGRIATHGADGPSRLISGLAPANIIYNQNAVSTLNVTLGSGADTFTFDAGTPASTTLNTGSGDYTVHVLNTSGPLTVNGPGGFMSRVNLGNPTSGVRNLLGPVTVNALPFMLSVSNAADAVGRVATHSFNAATGLASISGLAPADITYRPVPFVNITLGSGNDTFTCADIRSGLTTTLNTGPGNDTVNVQRTATGGNLTVTSSAGNDTVNLGNPANGVRGILGLVTVENAGGQSVLNVNNAADTVGRTVTQTHHPSGLASIGGLAPAGINYQRNQVSAVNLTLGSGADTFTFADTGPGPTTLNTGPGNDTVHVERTGGPLTVTSSGGNDTVNLGNPTNGVQGILGAVTVTNPPSYTTLNINDTGNTSGRTATYSVDGTNVATISGLAPSAIRYQRADVGALNLTLGSGDDSLTFLASGSPFPVAVNAGPGSDTLAGPATANTWSITAPDAGGFNSGFFFAAAENLVGNVGDDTFALADGAGLSGFLWDQGGNATLNYSAYSAGVYVNLTTYEATNVFGGVYGIPHVIGGAVDDILVGDDLANYLAGGPGRDLLIGGGAGYSGFADYLVGGAGEDIVIGGFTAYDGDAGALSAILAEWTQPTDYRERVANLSAGATAPALNEGTVFYNYSYGNVLLGEADLDLFFGDPTYDFSDWNPEPESFIPVF